MIRLRISGIVFIALVPALLLAAPTRAATYSRPLSEKDKQKYLRKEKKEQRSLREELSDLNWPIVFSSNADGASNIYRMNSDAEAMLFGQIG